MSRNTMNTTANIQLKPRLLRSLKNLPGNLSDFQPQKDFKQDIHNLDDASSEELYQLSNIVQQHHCLSNTNTNAISTNTKKPSISSAFQDRTRSAQLNNHLLHNNYYSQASSKKDDSTNLSYHQRQANLSSQTAQKSGQLQTQPHSEKEPVNIQQYNHQLNGLSFNENGQHKEYLEKNNNLLKISTKHLPLLVSSPNLNNTYKSSQLILPSITTTDTATSLTQSSSLKKNQQLQFDIPAFQINQMAMQQNSFSKLEKTVNNQEDISPAKTMLFRVKSAEMNYKREIIPNNQQYIQQSNIIVNSNTNINQISQFPFKTLKKREILFTNKQTPHVEKDNDNKTSSNTNQLVLNQNQGKNEDHLNNSFQQSQNDIPDSINAFRRIPSAARVFLIKTSATSQKDIKSMRNDKNTTGLEDSMIKPESLLHFQQKVSSFKPVSPNLFLSRKSKLLTNFQQNTQSNTKQQQSIQSTQYEQGQSSSMETDTTNMNNNYKIKIWNKILQERQQKLNLNQQASFKINNDIHEQDDDINKTNTNMSHHIRLPSFSAQISPDTCQVFPEAQVSIQCEELIDNTSNLSNFTHTTCDTLPNNSSLVSCKEKLTKMQKSINISSQQQQS